MVKEIKHYYAHMSSVRRAIKLHLPGASDVVVFREIVDGKIVFSVWF